MGKTSTEAAKAPDPQKAQFEAAKAAFEEAKRKTAAQEGLTKEEPEAAAPAPAPEPAKAAEKPQPKPKPVAKPAPAKIAAEKAPDPLAAIQAQLKALQEKLDARAAPEPEPEENPFEVISERLKERFGEDEASTLIEALEAIHGPAQKRIAQLEGVLREATKRGRQMSSKTNRQRLSESYPHLGTNEDAWRMVHEQALSMNEREPDRFASLDEAYDAVTQALYGGIETTGAAPDEEAEEEASRIAASTMTAPEKSASERKVGQLDAARAVLKHLKDNPEDLAGAKRIARELGSNRKTK